MPTDPLQPGRDYVIDRLGRWIFTKSYLLSRGQCCKSGCLNCPYGYGPQGKLRDEARIEIESADDLNAND